MPKRDRNHELETLSQRAFESALPANVLVRPIQDDYGIDREVEVFTDGEATGLTFKVQLKATDKSGNSQRIKRTSLEYWQAFDVPVLLVTYEARTGILRGRWVHSIGADAPDTGAETVTVHMDPTIDIGDTWAERLASDLRLIRGVRAGTIPSPTPVRIEVDVESLSPAQLTAGLFNLSRRSRVPMRQPVDADEATLAIEVTRTRVRASLPLQIASCSLHIEGRQLDDVDPRAVAELLLMLAAGAVAPVNEQCARAWLQAVRADAPWWSMPGIQERMITALNHAESAAHLFAIHAAMVERDDRSADVYMIPLLDLARELDADTFADYSARVSDSLPESWDGGRMAFNLSNLHRLRRDFQSSLDLLEVAARRAPQYLQDMRHQRDTAACLWELGSYDDSAAAYRRTLGLGADPYDALPLLADSLLHAGHFREALDALTGWEPNGTTADKAGHLRRVILEHVINYVGVEDQTRRTFDEEAATQAYQEAVADGEPTEETVLSLLRATDALHPRLWIHRVSPDGNNVDFRAALIVAFIGQHESFAWTLALVGALQEDSGEELVRAVIDQARFLCGDEFYDAVWAFADDQEAEGREYLRELISAAYSSEPERFTNQMRAVDELRAPWVIDVDAHGLAAHLTSDGLQPPS